MKKHLIDSIPAMTGLAAALTDATLSWAGTVHPSGATAVMYVSLAVALGRALSVWLHAQETPAA